MRRLLHQDVELSASIADDPDLPTLHDCALQTMDRILQLKSIACQESALHGLGHWHRDYREKVSHIIDRFCEAHPGSTRACRPTPNRLGVDAPMIRGPWLRPPGVECIIATQTEAPHSPKLGLRTHDRLAG
ncbi:protein of unknown function [Bradyrhizobium vignae]|uniref:Uncharacterized protein n=1 Tax=Bradyrhizobium vignae TaxID=1549949 RepID=A0A2U3Q8D6_9BRAD|nr:protein of unknown function [Bradyrhizobium vignae]